MVFYYPIYFGRRVLVVGRKHSSEQWLASGPGLCPLVSSLDLGTWDNKRDFWPNDSWLRRLNGVIKRIEGLQSGTIQMDGQVNIFFVPGGKRVDKDDDGGSVRRHVFERNKDEESPVNFFLGFSPVGLRAWMVQSGHVADGDRAVEAAINEAVRPIVLVEAEVPPEIIRKRVKELQSQTLRRFVRDLVKAQEDLGVNLSLNQLQVRVEAAFGVDNLFSLEGIGISSLEKFLLDDGDFELLDAGEVIHIRSKNKSRSEKGDKRERYTLTGEQQIGIVVFYDQKKGGGFN